MFRYLSHVMRMNFQKEAIIIQEISTVALSTCEAKFIITEKLIK